MEARHPNHQTETDSDSEQGIQTWELPAPDALDQPRAAPPAAPPAAPLAAPRRAPSAAATTSAEPRRVALAVAATNAIAATNAATATNSTAAPNNTVTAEGVAERGTHLDDLVQTILDRLERQEARTTERLNAIVAAQEASQDQIHILQTAGENVSQPLGDMNATPPRRAPTDERPRARRARPTSVVIGTIDEHSRDHQRGADTSPRRPSDDDSRAHDRSRDRQRHATTSPRRFDADDTRARDQELEHLRTTLKDMSSKVHRAISSAPELEKVLEEAQRSPFTARILKVRVRHANKIKIAKYEGSSDPKQFLTTVSIAIARAHFSSDEKDAGSCQIFVEHLSGAALNWFSRLKANSIDSFHQLSTAFLKHYSMYIEKGASNADLWTMSQGPKESLRKFIGRFKAVITSVAVPDDAAIAALRNAVWHESRFREDLLLNTPVTLEDALHRATRFIEFEEEKVALAKRHATLKVVIPKEKTNEEYQEPRQHCDSDYAKKDKGKRASNYFVNDSDTTPQKPWNKFYRTDDAKGDQLFCDYHKHPGHSTENCRTLTHLLLSKFRQGQLDIDNERDRSRDNIKTRD